MAIDTMLQIYMDESGTDDGAPVVTVGAYIARPSVWNDFTKRWNRQKYPINVFHAADCANCRGEFEGWEKAARDEYVAKLLPVLGDTNMLLPYATGIVLKDFDALIDKDDPAREYLGTPYGACFHWLVQTILEDLQEQRLDFFHETNDFKDDALQTFAIVKESNPHRSLSLAFATKEEFVPLQAADILAYEANKRLRKPKSEPDRRAFAALKIEGRGRVRYFDKDNLPGLIGEMRQAHEQFIRIIEELKH